MESVIKIQNLKKYFNSPRGVVHAVDDVSMHIEKGETMGVVGESGCGCSLSELLSKSHFEAGPSMIRWEITGNPVKSRETANLIEIKRSIFDSNFEKTLF